MDEQDMIEARPQWEHHIEYIKAYASIPQTKDFLASRYPGKNMPMYAVQAVTPRLDKLGEEGWELVHMQPVEVGVNGDILINKDKINGNWTNVYLCVFKRLRRSAQL